MVEESLHESCIDLGELVHDVVKSLGHRAKAGRVHLDFLVDHDVPKHIVADELRLTQVLTNLLVNAIKFSVPNTGFVYLRVSLTPSSSLAPKQDESERFGLVSRLMELVGLRPSSPRQNGRRLRASSTRTWVRFLVQDNGIGVSKETLPHLFKMFQQGSPEVCLCEFFCVCAFFRAESDQFPSRRQIASKYGGSGLGLQICKYIVHLMGGEIWMHSEGIGSGAKKQHSHLRNLGC